jgi:hypothetical protein
MSVQRLDFTDFVTGEPKSFSYNERGGSSLSMYTRRLANSSPGVIPVYLGTINEYTGTTLNTSFRSIPLGATLVKSTVSIFLNQFGPIRIRVLDGLPEGITWSYFDGEVTFVGRNVQSLPSDVLSALRNPSYDNYPVNSRINNLCYFRIRAERINSPEVHYSTWIYYFRVRIDWSTIRDTFISNTSPTFFSFDQKNFVTGEQFIQEQKSNGYYL